MCGILGFFSEVHGQGDAKAVAHKMLQKIVQRGPDDSGVWTESSMTLGHRRLSILDLSPAGHQPMASACGRFVIVFNGEIYNHQQIRHVLDKEQGWSWRGHSDTEVMLAAIASWGVARALEQFNGMFAFALWDRQERVLTLARDRFGEKPLYYAASPEGIVFGSELTCLEAYPGFDRTIDRDALCDYFRFKYFPAPRTIYKCAHKLPPAHFLQWSFGRGVTELVCYWDIDKLAASSQASCVDLSDEEAISHLDGLMRDAIALRMEADVPLGAFLSGGIDSSLVVALMQSQASQPVRTFSIGFDIAGYNEAEHAKAVAAYLGTSHTEQYVTGTEALAVVPSLGKIFDEPFADSSQIPTYLVSKIARQHVTVCLSGDGGDEIFGGYSRYQTMPRMWDKIARIPGRRILGQVTESVPDSMLAPIARLLGLLVNRYMRRPMTVARIREILPWLSVHDQYALYRLSMMSWKAPRQLVLGSTDKYASTGEASAPLEHFLHVMMLHDMKSYLPGDILTKVDRASMAVSLEGRIPLLDHRIAEFSWKLPAHQKLRGQEGKWLLRQVLYKYVPKSLLDRPKMGFGVPLGQWLRSDLREWADSLLEPNIIRSQGLISEHEVRQQWDAHCRGKGDYSDSLWPVLMLQAWLAERAV